MTKTQLSEKAKECILFSLANTYVNLLNRQDFGKKENEYFLSCYYRSACACAKRIGRDFSAYLRGRT